MKYSVSARQSDKCLHLADEIVFQYKDREALLDYEDRGLQDKDIVIVLSKEDGEIDWTFINMINDKFNLTLALNDLSIYKQFHKYNIPFYWNYAVTTYGDLYSLLEFGVNQVLITAPLTFDLIYLKVLLVKYGDIKLRMVANWAYENYIPRVNGITGTYVRPEDIPLYDNYITTMEFYSDNLAMEARLLSIYKEDKQWPGNLNILIHNLNVNIDNRAIPEEFAQNRINCKQKCMRDSNCHLCNNIFNYVRTVDRSRFDWDLEKHEWKVRNEKD